MSCCGSLPSFARLSCASVGPSAASILFRDSAPEQAGQNSELSREAWGRAREQLQPGYRTDDDCTICFHPLSEAPPPEYVNVNHTPEFILWVLPVCGHSFHAQCIERWLGRDESDRSEGCPLCTSYVSPQERGALAEAVVIARPPRQLRNVRARVALRPVDQLPLQGGQGQTQLAHQAAYSSGLYVFPENGDAPSPTLVAQQVFSLQVTVGTAGLFDDDRGGPVRVADAALEVMHWMLDAVLDDVQVWTDTWAPPADSPRYFRYKHSSCPDETGGVQILQLPGSDGTYLALERCYVARFWHANASASRLLQHATLWGGNRDWERRLARDGVSASRIQLNSVPDALGWAAENSASATRTALESFVEGAGDAFGRGVDAYNQSSAVISSGYPELDSVWARPVEDPALLPGRALEVVMRFAAGD